MLQWRKKRGRHGIGGGTGERRTLIYSIKVLSSQIVNHWKVQHLHYIYTMSQGGCIWKIINQLYNISINILCIDHPNLWRKKNEMMNRRNAPHCCCPPRSIPIAIAAESELGLGFDYMICLVGRVRMDLGFIGPIESP